MNQVAFFILLPLLLTVGVFSAVVLAGLLQWGLRPLETLFVRTVLMPVASWLDDAVYSTELVFLTANAARAPHA